MEKELPKVNFNQSKDHGIEVMTFEQLYEKLNKSKNHDPFDIHKIEFYLILVVTQNSYSHFVDFKSYKLTKGSTLFIAKNQVHHFTKELQEAEGFCIVFNHLFVDKHYFLSGILKLNRLFNYHIESPVIHQKDIAEDGFVDLVEKLYAEYAYPNKFVKSEILGSLLYVLLLKAERVKEVHAVANVKKHWLEVFNKFRNMLEVEYVNSRNSRHYASKLLISYKFLNDIVKKLTGQTVKGFIDDFVTTEIKRYLTSSTLSIKEISYATGFEDPPNMVKFFKKHTHTTPLKFRQQ